MIKVGDVSPLNTTQQLKYRCDECGSYGTINLENSIINTDDNEVAEETLDYECPECGIPLNQ